jgi:hypothetical protein
MKLFATALLFCSAFTANSKILEVGPGKAYQRLQQAAAVAEAGDTVMLFAGVYSGGDAITRLHGNAAAWITILAAKDNEVIFRGGTVAFQISEASYLRIEGLIFEQQRSNSVNVDDGGPSKKPAHHIHFERCRWRNINASGNNDELKLSGVDDFLIKQCVFSNGAAGGSLVDMVGCHRGVLQECVFENAGSNCIQAKGGSSDIIITRNKFINGGQRAVNIGGSTGLAFFRPVGANYEAKKVLVYANIFIGSIAPVAFVGAVDCAVENNTLYAPERWAVRILQETTAAGFLPCSNNIFSHNIIVFPDTRTDAINIGAHTAPETFKFSYNLWYRPGDTAWGGPKIPIPEMKKILHRSPLFVDTIGFRITQQSPARRAGDSNDTLPEFDYYGNKFAVPRSVGAVEWAAFKPK